MKTLRTFALAGGVTAAIWVVTALGGGWTALMTVATLTVLEITFSFDNAVVNSKLLALMSRHWQQLFMTVGILIAVFVVRFALPILIVDLTAHLSFGQVLNLALHHPRVYALDLTRAGPAIDAFGGAFLLMIAAEFFLDEEKDVHWVGWLERRLAPLGRYDNLGTLVVIGATVSAAITMTASSSQRVMVLVAAIGGVTLHLGLGVFGAIFDSDEGTRQLQLVGAAAAIVFLRLEVLDASFSFDGVIGAFAITSSVILIMAGLAAGAMWVRSLTVHLVRTGTLARYRYLEHGAHWAILALGAVMIAKLYGFNPPDVATGSIGLAFIALALASSIMRRESLREDHHG